MTLDLKQLWQYADGKAKDFLKNISPVSETSPARYYELILSSYNYTSESVNTELLNFYTTIHSPDQDACAVMAETLENNTTKFAGLAVLNGTKMVGEISPELVTSFLILTDKLKKATIAVKGIKNDNLTTVHLTQIKKPKIAVKIVDNIPIIDIKVVLDAKLSSDASETDYMQEENRKKLEERISDEVKKLLEEYLQKVIKEYKSDITGFGKFARANFLTWTEFENCKWNEIYPNSEYQLDVKVDLNVAEIFSHTIPEN